MNKHKTNHPPFAFKGRITDKIRIDFLDWLANRKSDDYRNAVKTTHFNLETDVYCYSGGVDIYARGTRVGAVEPQLDTTSQGKTWREAIDVMIKKYQQNEGEHTS